MDVREAIEKRRAYRALEAIEIDDSTISELAGTARLAGSCFNKQPWRFVFVRSPEMLDQLHATLSKGNEWAEKASMIVAVFCRKTDDCVINKREYYLFDTGMAVSAMILRATELDLVAHPIAGFDPEAARDVLKIPNDFLLITLLIMGKKSEDTSGLNNNQIAAEKVRPPRRKPEEFFSLEKYSSKLS
ncbi:MAG: nitroreductase family protein [Candidatus Krumholzibacteria bacterium]|nr:nitroreductase family protein [Candidatus Krumholzibacteria bacterium]